MSQPLESRIYCRDECVVFRKTNEAFGGLSNMAPGFPVPVNGILILTVEALYQACRFPHLPEVQRLILEQRSPMTAKMVGKPHREESRPDLEPGTRKNHEMVLAAQASDESIEIR